jgi:hypothetical protein
MDLTALLPVAIGAVLAGAFTLLGAWVQARREHAKWLREKRYEAFLEAHVLVENMKAYMGYDDSSIATLRKLLAEHAGQNATVARAERVLATSEDVQREGRRVIAAIRVLGPDGIPGALQEILEAEQRKDAAAAAAAKATAMMRVALRISG